jgi:hypothetical protein
MIVLLGDVKVTQLIKEKTVNYGTIRFITPNEHNPRQVESSLRPHIPLHYAPF